MLARKGQAAPASRGEGIRTIAKQEKTPRTPRAPREI